MFDINNISRMNGVRDLIDLYAGRDRKPAEKSTDRTKGADRDDAGTEVGRTLQRLTRTGSTLNRGIAGRAPDPAYDDAPPTSRNELGFLPPRRAVRLPNLRALRPDESYRPWEIESDGIHLTVTPKTLQPSLDWERWQLTVDIDMPNQNWRLDSFRLLTNGTSVLQEPKRSGNRVRSVVLVEAPLECELRDARQPVKLILEMTVDGRRETRTIELDHRCLIGDSIKQINARSIADIAEKYLYDPFIERMVERAKNTPRGSVQSEVAQLRNWLGFDKTRWLSDPPNADKGFEDQVAYILAPEETARLGGDCEDYSILQAAYLTRRGFATYIAHERGHTWVQVATPGGGTMVNVDWLPGGTPMRTSSPARVRPRPPTPPSK